MKLIYIYGPPAAGKLTTARALSELTGFRLFHNHLSIACVSPVFDFGTDPFWRQVHLIRQNVLEAAARENVDLIYTGVFTFPKDLELITRRLGGVEANGGAVCLVQLTCAVEALEARVPSSDRLALQKVGTVQALRKVLSTSDVFTMIPGRATFAIDNTTVAASDAARLIAQHYDLPLIAPSRV